MIFFFLGFGDGYIQMDMEGWFGMGSIWIGV